MTRALVVISLVCAALSEIGIAQAKPATTPTLQETLLWMHNFSREHGFLYEDDRPRLSNSFSSKGCNASVEVLFPNAKARKTSTTNRTMNMKLEELNPKVTLQTISDNSAVEVYFEPVDAQTKIHENLEYGDGGKLEAWVASETLYFDSRGSAMRFARAFSRAITLCAAIASTENGGGQMQGPQ
jgi:hypothetical protein